MVRRNGAGLYADALCIVALMVLAYGLALELQQVADFAIPRRNAYFNADTDRVFANLIDRNSNYTRLAVHPLFGWPCIVFQKIVGSTGSLRSGLAAWSGLHGEFFALFLYVAIRVWGGDRATATAGTMLGLSSAAFIYWVPITETHLMGGITVLALAALWRWRPAGDVALYFQSAVMFVLGASVVLTNVAAWGLAQLRLERVYAGKIGQAVRENLAGAGPVAVAGLVGLGILGLVSMAVDTVLDNPSVPLAGSLWFEAKYISASRGSVIGLIDVLGLVHNTGGPFWLLNLAAVVPIVWALMRNGPARAFLALWPVFALLLHSVYDRSHGFLFSPNYLPLGVVAVSLAAGSWKSGPLALLAAAAVCAPINYLGYVEKRADIAAQTDPPEWYNALRAPHPVPESDIVRPADPPIRFDQ